MGAGEDTDFCIRAIRAGYTIEDVGGTYGYDAGQDVAVGTFPIWHKGGSTVKAIQGFVDVFAANGRLLQERYGVKDAR